MRIRYIKTKMKLQVVYVMSEPKLASLCVSWKAGIGWGVLLSKYHTKGVPKSANLRICDLQNLFAVRPTFEYKTIHMYQTPGFATYIFAVGKCLVKIYFPFSRQIFFKKYMRCCISAKSIFRKFLLNYAVFPQKIGYMVLNFYRNFIILHWSLSFRQNGKSLLGLALPTPWMWRTINVNCVSIL